MKHITRIAVGISWLFSVSSHAALDREILTTPSSSSDCISLVGTETNAAVIVDEKDFPVVQLAANFFADDVARVAGRRLIVTNTPAAAPQIILVGTLGHSALIDALAANGKLTGLDKIKDHWETTLSQLVENPFPGVSRALVIVGSDRRGAAYGLMTLSEKIGVSPWYWWADVSVPHQKTLAIKVSATRIDAPGVKYRGIFINDEDWGLNPWASKTFDPEFKNIGPKTYEKVFELLLRLRLNYIWPAMHGCSREFASTPENAALADKFGIVAGSSHCEPMLCNNVHWNEKTKGPWNYSLNRDTIHTYWEDSVKSRASDEAVWTLGIRGIHDRGMETPPSKLPDQINLVNQVIQDQRDLLARNVTKQWGDVAQCFVPYKEVLPIYDAGLNVPDDVTLVWVDDNFGYIRRLSAPAERKRSGGSGVYWHLSYYGPPHSYTWINTTAPALIWEELHKAWENDARTLWVINVGDIKPMEIGIDYFSRFAWNPEGFDLPIQREFLRVFAAKNFGGKFATSLGDLLMQFYQLGTIHKPELMNREWALSLTQEEANNLESNYRSLLKTEQSVFAKIPAESRDAYTETIGFPARVLGASGLIFMADRKVRQGRDVSTSQNEIARLRSYLETQVDDFNTKLAGGKWNHMMPGLVTGKNLKQWNSQVRWPLGETNSPAKTARFPIQTPAVQNWRDAAMFNRSSADGVAKWTIVEGLGDSGRAVALQPTSLASSWREDDSSAPLLEYNFESKATNIEAFVDFLPTFRIYPGTKLRVAVSVDEQAPAIVEVPGSSGAENENGTVRSRAVQDNYVRAQIPLSNIEPGKHTFKIRAIDPGAVIDRISLP